MAILTCWNCNGDAQIEDWSIEDFLCPHCGITNSIEFEEDEAGEVVIFRAIEPTEPIEGDDNGN